MTRRWMELVTVTLLCGGATAAAANDLCLVDDLGLPPLVITNFAFPKAGQCVRFRGSFQDGAFLASGLACGSMEVDNINFKIDIEPPIVGETTSYSFFVNRETLTGEGAIFCVPAKCDVVFGIPFGSLTFSIRQVACPPEKSSGP
jgi:hypothetical protein